ncbi:hypothetical protein DV515_00012898 [Chloebia gouldiae]|uniref:Uncharacterized protein n=1 Tax=Chloebia gouldiae TaxID=44316 RepID=A0A3L8S3M3_CHLGU|nr:hypothetical protein DV515_00012898 [Chloebia gouldiae]
MTCLFLCDLDMAGSHQLRSPNGRFLPVEAFQDALLSPLAPQGPAAHAGFAGGLGIAPFRQQTDSAVEKNTEGSCASTPLGVITNHAVLGTANGTGNAGAASAPGKDLSAEEARERRRSAWAASVFPKHQFALSNKNINRLII